MDTHKAFIVNLKACSFTPSFVDAAVNLSPLPATLSVKFPLVDDIDKVGVHQMVLVLPNFCLK